MRCPVCEDSRARAFEPRSGPRVWECRCCRARYLFPLPGDRVLRQRYEAEHAAGKWRERFEQADASEVRRRAELVRAHVEAASPRVLDVGAGDGSFLRAAAAAGLEPFGCEIAAAAASTLPLGASFYVGSLESLREAPLFDAITFWDVLEHMPEPRATLALARTRLRPGGIIGISMPNLRGTASLALGASWPYYDLETYGHLSHLSARHLRMLLANVGMALAYQETRGTVDLRDVPQLRFGRQVGPLTTRVLDRMSGLLARITEPLGYGSTIIVLGRREA